ncbi:hypothetical protein [Azotobacter chroococcum]|jgi:hypothetical protein|uniref:hypothetical protein n=1 Tax=Azotobacter chroococcum TaxID=353 RepID=UPI001405518E|nr:hypothetical protein [Azotobacter chroococcum]
MPAEIPAAIQSSKEITHEPDQPQTWKSLWLSPCLSARPAHRCDELPPKQCRPIDGAPSIASRGRGNHPSYKSGNFLQKLSFLEKISAISPQYNHSQKPSALGLGFFRGLGVQYLNCVCVGRC